MRKILLRYDRVIVNTNADGQMLYICTNKDRSTGQLVFQRIVKQDAKNTK